MNYDRQTILEIKDILEKLPSVVKDLSQKLEEILVVLEMAKEIEDDMTEGRVWEIGFTVYSLICRGLPFGEAIRQVSKAEKMPKKDVIYCYKWRYRRIRQHQQYTANLCVKLLIEAGYKRISACRIVEKMGLPSSEIAEPEEICDGFTREVVDYPKFEKADK